MVLRIGHLENRNDMHTTNLTILVTGATDGIGLQTALEIARLGATVLLHGRNPDRGRTAFEHIERQTGSNALRYYNADLSDMQAVSDLGARLLSEHDRIDVLIHNAGVHMSRLERNADGFEMTFAVNHLAPFLLTRRLLDGTAGDRAPKRIVVVSSVAHTRARLDFDNLNAEKEFSPYGAYALSKLLNVLFAYHLARQFDGSGTTVNALHPGVITTKLLTSAFGTTGASLEEGAATSVHLATSPLLEGVTGRYFAKRQEAQSSAVSHDIDAQQRLWTLSERLLARYLD
jgi:retinol dehydrogenase 14